MPPAPNGNPACGLQLSSKIPASVLLEQELATCQSSYGILALVGWPNIGLVAARPAGPVPTALYWDVAYIITSSHKYPSRLGMQFIPIAAVALAFSLFHTGCGLIVSYRVQQSAASACQQQQSEGQKAES